MAKRGRPRKPRDLKVIDGNFRKPKPGEKPEDKAKKGQASLPADAPPKPDSLDEAEGKIWDELIPHLNKIGTLQRCDAGSLEAYCTAVATLRRNKKILSDYRAKNQGSDFYTNNSQHGEVIRMHPAVGVIERTTKTIKMLADEFGMTPASRKGMGYDPRQLFLPGLGGGKAEENDPTAALLGDE